VLSSTERLHRLVEILTPARTAGSVDATVHAAAAERIRRLTEELAVDPSDDPDAITAVGMRLLLNEYVGVLTSLRATVREAADHIDTAATRIGEARKFIWREGKERERMRQRMDGVDAESDATAGS
jgi:hypothetical protein